MQFLVITAPWNFLVAFPERGFNRLGVKTEWVYTREGVSKGGYGNSNAKNRTSCVYLLDPNEATSVVKGIKLSVKNTVNQYERINKTNNSLNIDYCWQKQGWQTVIWYAFTRFYHLLAVLVILKCRAQNRVDLGEWSFVSVWRHVNICHRKKMGGLRRGLVNNGAGERSYLNP